MTTTFTGSNLNFASIDGGVTNRNLTLNESGSTSAVSGAIGSNVNNIVLNGAGTINLANANSYTGSTTVNAGTLGVGSNTALSGGNLILNNGTTLAASSNVALGNTYSVGNVTLGDASNNTISLTGTGTLSGTLNVVNTGATTLAALNGQSSGVGSLTSTVGAGTITLNGLVGATALNSINIAGALNLNNNVTTTAGQTYGGAVALGSNVILSDSSSSATGVNFASTISNASGTRNLSIVDSGTSNSINITGNIGTAGNALGIPSFTSTGTTTLGGAVYGAASLSTVMPRSMVG